MDNQSNPADQLQPVSERLAELIPASRDAMPAIELYMDQVLEYIAQNPVSFSGEDKLTSAMINNYIKEGLVPRANGKKYAKKHFAALMMIARLKQVLSVKYTGRLLRFREAECGEGDYYEEFRMIMKTVCGNAAEALSKNADNLSAAALHFAADSYVKKVISEYIIDMLSQNMGEKKDEKQKTKK